MRRPGRRVTEKEALEWVERRAKAVDQESLDRVVLAEKILERKKKKIPGRAGRFRNQLGLAFEMIKDYRQGVYPKVPWVTISMTAAAIIYFLNPLDLVLDAIPVVGMVDDALVLTALYAAVRSDLLDYCLFKGYEPADYFS